MKQKVLMLGWEFPPVINGGLGVASLGLAEALASQVDLTMIIPRSAPDFSPEGLNLIGLDKIKLKKLFKEESEYSSEILKKVAINYVDVPLAGYEQPTLRIKTTEETEETLTIERKIKVEEEILPPKFKIDELYGDDLLERIREFTIIASRLAEDIDFDIIHAHDWMTFLAALEIKAWSNKPLVVHVHSLEYDRSGEGMRGFAWYLEKHAMEQADLVIPVSKYSGKIIEETYQIPAKKIFPVYNGVEKIEERREESPFPQKVVTFLGRITGQKGPETFLKIAWQILKNYDPVRFVLAGTGDLMPAMMEKVAKERLGDRIHFTEFLSREDTMELLAMTDVLVMPSVSEPFGLVAAEAINMGVPCVLSKQSGVSEILPNAFVADHWDVETLAKYTLSLLESPELHKSSVEKMKHDLEKFTWDYAAEKVVEGYSKMKK